MQNCIAFFRWTDFVCRFPKDTVMEVWRVALTWSQRTSGTDTCLIFSQWSHFLNVPCHEKHIFSGLYIYKLVLPEPANSQNEEIIDSCVVSAAQPLVTRRSFRLFRFSSFHYITKGVIIIGRPPLHGDRRYKRGRCSSSRWSLCVQRWDSSVSLCCRSELEMLIALLFVVKINISA